MGSGLNTEYPIKEEWKEKGVVFFAYFNSQKFTPYKKLAFFDNLIVIVDTKENNSEELKIIIDDVAKWLKFYSKAFKFLCY